MTDQRTFRFQMNGRPANAHSVGAEHVCLAFSADGVAVSAIMKLAEAGAMAAAVTRAIEASVSLGMEVDHDAGVVTPPASAVARVASPATFDAVGEAERVRQACGDQAAPRLPAEDR